MKGKILLTSLLSIVVTGCVSHVPPNTSDLAQLQRLSSSTVTKPHDGISGIRLKALQDTAISLGAQSGLAVRSKEINHLLEREGSQLSQTYNFSALLLQDNVLPPVLVEGRDILNLADSQTIRLADRTFEIIQQARFVTTPPDWREYLWMNYKEPPVPHVTLLPQNRKERAVWEEAVTQGWSEGALQADSIFASNLARLKRDYTGIVLYRKLLSQNMVSMPYVAKADLGITGGGSNMRINDQVLRITALPQLRANSKVWKPAVKQ